MPKFKKGDAVTFNRKRLLESKFDYSNVFVLTKGAMLDNLTDGKKYIIPNDYIKDDVGISITIDNGTTVFCHQDFFDAVADKKVFNIGDIVVFTTPDAGGHAQNDCWAKEYCEIGKEYKINSVSSLGIFVNCKHSYGLWVNPNQFTLKSQYDMQKQEKQNLKPFNLERALAGDPVITRGGKKVLELHFFSTPNTCPIAGFIDGSITLQRWTIDGYEYEDATGILANESIFDLFMAPIEKSGFIKIFSTKNNEIIKAATSCIYDNEADALNFSSDGAPTGIVVPIKWVE